MGIETIRIISLINNGLVMTMLFIHMENHSLNGRYSFRIWDFTTNQEGIDVTQHKCLHKDPNKRKFTGDHTKGCPTGNKKFGSLELSVDGSNLQQNFQINLLSKNVWFLIC